MENIEQPTEELNGAQFNLDEGSILGKFKDATSLLNAYTSLQAEFTRKSQKLKELEKQVNTDTLSPKESALQPQTDKSSNVTASENKDCITTGQSLENKVNNSLIAFVETNAEATEYLEDIKNELLESSELLDMGGGIEIAYRLAKEKHKSLPAELVTDAQFIQEYILSNPQITSMVIDEYIKSLAQKNITPKIMSGQSKAMVFSPNENKPQTLADANKIFSKMLEK